MPTATWGGGDGISDLDPKRSFKSLGGMPMRTQRAFCVCRHWLSRVGMLASVPSSTVWACSTSRLEVVPPFQRAVAICKLLFWTTTFWRAIASRFSRVRMEM